MQSCFSSAVIAGRSMPGTDTNGRKSVRLPGRVSENWKQARGEAAAQQRRQGPADEHERRVRRRKRAVQRAQLAQGAGAADDERRAPHIDETDARPRVTMTGCYQDWEAGDPVPHLASKHAGVVCWPFRGTMWCLRMVNAE